MPTETENQLVLVPLNGVAGNAGTPGAPLLYLYLEKDSETGAVTGHAVQTQAVAPPGNRIVINNVTGWARSTGFGKFTQLLAVNGEAIVNFPPPAIGSFLSPFSAHFALEADGSGTGGWSLGSTRINNVPFRSTK